MRRQRGFGAIAAIVILVILAGLSAALVSLGTAQHLTSAQDILSARAQQAARAGAEWGLYQAFKGSWTSCSAASQHLDLTADTGFHVTVSCDLRSYQEGETTPGNPKEVKVYTITAVACPATTCPSVDANVVPGPGYVERTRTVIAAD